MNFVTFIRNEVRNTSIHYKNEIFVTNLDTNFWMIMIVIKSSQNFFNRIYAIESHILLNISSSISVNGGIYHECRKRTFAIR